METRYSKTKFEGYTHRFKIQFEVGKPFFENIDIYSNSDSYQKLENFINERKSEKVISFNHIRSSTHLQKERFDNP